MMNAQQVPETLSSVCPLSIIPEGYGSVRGEDRVEVNNALLKLAELKPSRSGSITGIRIAADDRRACIIITLVGCAERVDASTYAQLKELPSFCDVYTSLKEEIAALVLELYTTRHPNHGKRISVVAASGTQVMDEMAARNAPALRSVIAQAENVIAQSKK
jgi:hypothetical protein